MGCASSFEAATDAGHPFVRRCVSAGRVDLALHPTLDDAAAAAIAATVAVTPTTALVAPRWPCPDAPLTHVGLLHLCLAAAPALRTLELNEAAIPRVTGWGAARALRILTELREVSLRGDRFPLALLTSLSSGDPHPIPSVKSLLLAGECIAAALLFIPKLFPCLEVLCLQRYDGHAVADIDVEEPLAEIVSRGGRFERLRRVVIDGGAEGLPTLATVRAFQRACPKLLLSFDDTPAVHAVPSACGQTAATQVDVNGGMGVACVRPSDPLLRSPTTLTATVDVALAMEERRSQSMSASRSLSSRAAVVELLTFPGVGGPGISPRPPISRGSSALLRPRLINEASVSGSSNPLRSAPHSFHGTSAIPGGHAGPLLVPTPSDAAQVRLTTPTRSPKHRRERDRGTPRNGEGPCARRETRHMMARSDNAATEDVVSVVHEESGPLRADRSLSEYTPHPEAQGHGGDVSSDSMGEWVHPAP